jgi:putative restriction endonuclease
MSLVSLIEAERARRDRAWRELVGRGGPLTVSPKVLRELGIYGGAQGVWVDKARTAPLTLTGTGITVGVLHTGSSYADDLSADGLLYHYPRTARGESRDMGEVEATKEAKRQQVPLFVVTHPTPHSSVRDVRMGWVEDWDDRARIFLISFGQPPASFPAELGDSPPFELVAGRRTRRREVAAREGQPRFKFRVLARYGARCAVCDLDVATVLDAAHLCPDSAGGTDDPRNGLVLCATHHRALDAGLFLIDPDSFRVQLPSSPITAGMLRLMREDLTHLPNLPHREALQWLWRGKRTDFTGCAFAGSQLQVQIYVNRRQDELSRALCTNIDDLSGRERDIKWVAPLERDGFREYWDQEALRVLGVAHVWRDLQDFWPSGGPHWDALAVVETPGEKSVVLVEAKSHPREVYSAGMQAVAPASMSHIRSALLTTKQQLGVAEDADWTGRLYQTANRLAHLHFFRNRVGIRAWLVNAYFLEDPHPEWHTTRTQWEHAIRATKEELGIGSARIPHLGEIFLTSRSRAELK